jgi:raffinose/stachyose/melibiose transport system permease protein
MVMNVWRIPARTIAAFVLPGLLLYGVMIFVPILISFYYSLVDWNGIGKSEFVGLQNFVDLFTKDDIFWPAVRRTLLFTLFAVAVIPVSLFIAIWLNRHLRKPNWFVTSYFLPVILSIVIIGQLWKTIYNPASMGGMLNQLLIKVGLESWTHAWMMDPSTAIYAIYFVFMWQSLGYHILIQFTGVRNLPAEIFEAARIDGAEGFQADRYITLPMMIPIIKISIVLAVIGSIQSFDLTFIMTGGGPAHTTELISTHMYNMSFLSMKYGYGSAVATVLVLLCLTLTLVVNLLFSRFEKRVY